ncbi:MAG: plastocyanin/azurin family copper-binding protein, partial [Pseudomonadota bacterium]
MPINLTRRAMLAASATFTTLAATGMTARAAGHATHTVEMLNTHPEDRRLRMVYYPRVLKVAAGDTVNFKSVDRGHNSASIDGMIPEGAEEWDSKIGDDVEVTFNTPGVYGYQCTPHASAGMVGLI